MIYRDPRSGQTQDVAERETVRRQILEQAGWTPDSDLGLRIPAPADAPERITVAPGGVTVRIGDELVMLPSGMQPMAKPGYKLVEVTDNDSDVAEFIEVPEDAPTSKRKRSK